MCLFYTLVLTLDTLPNKYYELLILFYSSLIITGRKRRGAAPAIYVKASSSIARHVLQQLESVKVLEQDEDNG